MEVEGRAGEVCNKASNTFDFTTCGLPVKLRRWLVQLVPSPIKTKGEALCLAQFKNFKTIFSKMSIILANDQFLVIF